MGGGTAIGIDIGGTHLRAARVSSSGEILERVVEKSAPDPEIVLRRIIDLIGRVDAPDVVGIGIGVPGRVDAGRRVVLSGGYVNLASVPLAERVAGATGRPVAIDNDANMALVAELTVGAARGHGNVAMFTIGTGIGGSIAENGRILRGRATAGQLGHITIDMNGAPCLCGRRGCLETTSSGSALGRHIAAAGLPVSTSADDLLARGGDEASREAGVIRAWAMPLRAAVDSAVATLDPELVLLGGGLGGAARAALARIPAPAPWYRCRIEAAALGGDAGVIGAGLSALPAGGDLRARAGLPLPAKRAILVNGVPASGKSTVSRSLSDRTGWSVLSLDTVKDPFLTRLGGDRAFNRTLGQASYQAIWSLMRDAPAGTTAIVDAWFGFQPREVLETHLAMAGVEETVEIWCHAPPEVVAQRYGARLGDRPAGHPGAAYIPELIELARRAGPIRRGPVLDVDTTEPLDIAALAASIPFTKP